MLLCSRCILPETFPGIKFDRKGVCNFCGSFKGQSDLEQQKREYKQKFGDLLTVLTGKGRYDALMAYSGGKDSTYTLYILKAKYKLNVLAVTFDNGFISSRAFTNIQQIVERLDIDHIIYKPRFDILKKIFVAGSKEVLFSRKTLDRASTICTSCIGLVKSIALRTALEKQIPFIAFGWSPGQAPINSCIFKNNAFMIKAMQEAIKRPLQKIAGDDIAPYFLEEEHFKMTDRFPTNISPLAFLKYDESKIIKKIQELGWVPPHDTDANSTNCLLNSFANKVHKEKYHYHPYVFEIAKMVREGVLDREEALEKINRPEDEQLVKSVKKRLGC